MEQSKIMAGRRQVMAGGLGIVALATIGTFAASSMANLSVDTKMTKNSIPTEAENVVHDECSAVPHISVRWSNWICANS